MCEGIPWSNAVVMCFAFAAVVGCAWALMWGFVRSMK
jgi:hypothetical protein